MKNDKLHYCEISSPSGGYGNAVVECSEEEDGELWVTNGEYASQVNYCPKCGFAAKKRYEEESS